MVSFGKGNGGVIEKESLYLGIPQTQTRMTPGDFLLQEFLICSGAKNRKISSELLM